MIILEYIWPLLLALIGGLIVGIIFVKAITQKIGILQKLSLVSFIIIAIIAGIVVTFSITLYGDKLTKTLFVRKVRIIKDIDLQKDYYFGNEKTLLKGTIEKGSITTRTFAKGGAQYLIFSTIVDSEHVEIMEN